MVQADDPSGTWLPTTQAKPGVVRVLDCYPNYMGYHFRREGGGVAVKVLQVYHGGPALTMFRTEWLTGAWRGGTLTLTGTAGMSVAEGVSTIMSTPAPVPVTYVLRADRATGHLVGTRDGKPWRLARLVLYKPDDGDCGPAPP